MNRPGRLGGPQKHNTMKIYKLELTEVLMEHCSCDFYDSHIVVAENGTEARRLAKNKHADEGADVWDDANLTLLGTYTGTETKAFIACSSFNAG